MSADLQAYSSIAHVALGTVAVLAGAVALAAQKGHATHIGAGRLFLITLGISAALGAFFGLVSIERHYITFHAGILTLTLITSGWLTARDRSGGLSRAALTVGLVNLANITGMIAVGLWAQSRPGGVLFGFPAEDYFYLAGMAALAVVGDTNLAIRKTLSDRNRIARHLWRMCLGFFIAAGSAFTGPGAVAFSEPMRESGILALPELIIIVLMLVWLVRTLVGNRPQSRKGTV